jgi:uncharacterized protein YjbJ (UPF0337 family)
MHLLSKEYTKEIAMNEDIIKGKWNQLKGDVQKRWGKLTNDRIDQVAGDRTKLLGAIQESYGLGKDEAEKQLKDWERSHAA